VKYVNVNRRLLVWGRGRGGAWIRENINIVSEYGQSTLYACMEMSY
jgi:hypothetical protein